MHKIVLTGGPCGGKTTALAKITDYFASHGFNVLKVPEAATLMISGGAMANGVDKVSFQTELVKIQKTLEESFTKLAHQLEGKTVILCDRGHMDNAAYLTEDEWQAVMDTNGWTLVGLRDRNYDAVIHMVTAAKGAPDAYTTENNAARHETPEQAVELDGRTMRAWIGHPHLRVIDNETDFDTKIDRAIGAICRVVGIPEPLEIERKYLVSFESMPVPYQDVEIEQTYLNPLTHPGERIRRRGQNGVNIYFHTRKRGVTSMVRAEVERQISPREYVNFLQHQDLDRHTIKKTRRCFVWDGQYFELDMFRSPVGLTMLEVELHNEDDEVRLPPFLDVSREVTNDRRYTNRELARLTPS